MVACLPEGDIKSIMTGFSSAAERLAHNFGDEFDSAPIEYADALRASDMETVRIIIEDILEEKS